LTTLGQGKAEQSAAEEGTTPQTCTRHGVKGSSMQAVPSTTSQAKPATGNQHKTNNHYNAAPHDNETCMAVAHCVSHGVDTAAAIAHHTQCQPTPGHTTTNQRISQHGWAKVCEQVKHPRHSMGTLHAPGAISCNTTWHSNLNLASLLLCGVLSACSTSHVKYKLLAVVTAKARNANARWYKPRGTSKLGKHGMHACS
jgi:hypothetical protein